MCICVQFKHFDGTLFTCLHLGVVSHCVIVTQPPFLYTFLRCTNWSSLVAGFRQHTTFDQIDAPVALHLAPTSMPAPATFDLLACNDIPS